MSQEKIGSTGLLCETMRRAGERGGGRKRDDTFDRREGEEETRLSLN